MSQNATYLKLFSASILTLIHLYGVSQYSELEATKKLGSFQIIEDEFYDAGLFPSQRTWSFSNKSVEDNTIFFTASIISTLRELYPQLVEENRDLVDSIIKRVNPVYDKYKSRNGETAYNFWQTTPPDLPFPNGSKLISNEGARLPDDFDTSILILQALGKNDSLDHLFRKKMISYAKRESRSEAKLITPEKYQNMKAYEVWFGKDMPQTFDLCVMSNVMSYVLDRDFQLNMYDSATISLIKRMIQANDHLNSISDVSHHSDSPALILYHVARVISKDEKGFFSSIKNEVITDLKSTLNEVENEVEKIMIAISLQRLTHKSDVSIDFKKLEKDVKSFSFFYVNPFNVSKGKSRYLPTVTWVSEAYNWTLYLEWLVLAKSSN